VVHARLAYGRQAKETQSVTVERRVGAGEGQRRGSGSRGGGRRCGLVGPGRAGPVGRQGPRQPCLLAASGLAGPGRPAAAALRPCGAAVRCGAVRHSAGPAPALTQSRHLQCGGCRPRIGESVPSRPARSPSSPPAAPSESRVQKCNGNHVKVREGSTPVGLTRLPAEHEGE